MSSDKSGDNGREVDQRLARVRTESELAAVLESLREESGLTYEELTRRLGETLGEDTRPRTSTVHDWFTLKSVPSRRNESQLRACLLIVGLQDPSPAIELMKRFRRQRLRKAAINPYLGLEAFTADDRHLFFGRDAFVNDSLRKIDELMSADPHRPVVFVGASGSGKSSVLQAGILWQLNSARTSCSYVQPGSRPFEDLSVAINAIRDTRSAGSAATRNYLIVDQIERLLIDGDSRSLELLEDCAGQEILLVLGLRSDFYRQASEHAFLTSALDGRAIHVGPVSPDNASECVTGPASVAQLTIEPELLAAVMSDVQLLAERDGNPFSLPLLSHAMSRTTQFADEGRLTLDAYRAAGGLAGALGQSAEDAFERLGPDNRLSCRHLFGLLVQLGPDGIVTGRVVNRQELEASVGPAYDTVVEEFTESRLLVADHDEVRLSHELLLSEWDRLRGWIEEAHEELGVERRVRQSTDAWIESGKDPHTLLTGPLLESGTRLLDDSPKGGRLTDRERAFLLASVEAQQSAEARRRRTTVGLVLLSTLLAALAITSAFFAVEARRSSNRADAARDEALSRQLALRAAVIRETDPPLAHQIALVAYQTHATTEARSAVLDAAAQPPNPRYLGAAGPTAVATATDGGMIAYSNSVDSTISVLRQGDSGYQRDRLLSLASEGDVVFALDTSGDSQWLASGGTDNAVTLWDLATSESAPLPSNRVQFDGPVQTVRFSSDGSKLYAGGDGEGVGWWSLTGDGAVVEGPPLVTEGRVMSIALDTAGEYVAAAKADGSVVLWDSSMSAQPLWSVPPDDETIASTVAISPSGDLLVAGYRNSTIRAWDLSDPVAPEEVDPGIGPFASWVTWAEFSPDGQRLVTASSDGGVRLWDPDGWQQVGPELPHPNVVTSARFQGRDSLVVAVADGSVRTWDLAHPSFDDLGASVWSTSFDNAGTSLVASSGLEAGLWEFQAGEVSRFVELQLPDPDLGLTGAAAMSPDGELVALGTRTGPVIVVPTEAGSQPQGESLGGLTALVENVAFSNDGRVIAGTDDDGRVQLWTEDETGWRERGQLVVDDLAMNVAFAPDGQTLVALSSNGTATLVDLSDLDVLAPLSEITTGDSVAFTAAFHPELPWLATGNADTSIKIWDYGQRGEPSLVSEAPGPNSRIFSLAFSNDGRRLAAAVGDNTAWMWSLSMGELPRLDAIFDSPEGAVISLAFSPDNQYLVGAGADRHLVIWDLEAEAAIDRLCRQTGDPITSDEWSDYVTALPFAPPCQNRPSA